MIHPKASSLALAALATAGALPTGHNNVVIRRRLEADEPRPPQSRPVRAPYVPAPLPLTDSDREQINAAERKRARKNAKRSGGGNA